MELCALDTTDVLSCWVFLMKVLRVICRPWEATGVIQQAQERKGRRVVRVIWRPLGQVLLRKVVRVLWQPLGKKERIRTLGSTFPIIFTSRCHTLKHKTFEEFQIQPSQHVLVLRPVA